jgi:hypothetical protein
MSTLGANLVFQEAINGACGFELIEAPFEKDFADIAELALFVGREFFEFGAQRLADSEADLCFPLTHLVPSCVRAKAIPNKVMHRLLRCGSGLRICDCLQL